MFLNDAHFPVAVLHVLSEEMPQTFSGVVPTPDLNRLPNFTSATNKPKIELVVLIPNKLLIK